MNEVLSTTPAILAPIATSQPITQQTQIEMWISLLGTFSTVLLGVFGILAAILGYLTWSQNKMREKAEVEMKKITKIAQEMDKLYKSYTTLMKDSSEMFKTTKGLVEKASGQVKEAAKLLTDLAQGSANVKTTLAEMNKIRNSLNKDVSNLSNVSNLMQGTATVVDATQLGSLSDYLRNTVDEPSEAGVPTIRRFPSTLQDVLRGTQNKR